MIELLIVRSLGVDVSHGLSSQPKLSVRRDPLASAVSPGILISALALQRRRLEMPQRYGKLSVEMDLVVLSQASSGL